MGYVVDAAQAHDPWDAALAFAGLRVGPDGVSPVSYPESNHHTASRPSFPAPLAQPTGDTIERFCQS